MKSLLRTAIAAACFIFLFSFISGCWLQPENVLGTLERETPQGTIIGQLHTHNGYECQRYLGIPYAKAPVGDLRFKPPQDPAPFKNGKREAFDYGPMCPQLVYGVLLSGDEDCLFLNVWAPRDAKPGDRYPVMFFMHGGGNNLGSGNQALSDFLGMAEEAVALDGLNYFFDRLKKITTLDEPIYQGNYLAARHNVILVTINYRLGQLGHLAHPDLGEGSGNFTFLDMVKALQWVNRSIANFGGDRDNVTIFGESSGAWDVCALMNMPAAKGLFHKAIMESQACLSRTIEQAEDYASPYIRASGCSDAADVGACLRKADINYFVTAMSYLYGLYWRSFGFIPHIPAVDGTVFPKHFAEAITTDQFNHVPLIIGNNQNELAVAIASDIGFNCPLDANLAIFARHLRAPMYQYRFVHHPLNDMIPVIHMFELPYVFGATRDLFGGTLKREIAVENVVSSYWTSFARTGDPNSGDQIYWPPYDRASQRYLKLKATPEEDAGDIIYYQNNCVLCDPLLNAVMGEQIVFW
ncbi:MAG: carboxylesterase family protein [Spirochaetes bacterium]|nr:carboxylesterase family protein [Spirochaetota bacterium]